MTWYTKPNKPSLVSRGLGTGGAGFLSSGGQGQFILLGLLFDKGDGDGIG